MSTPASAQKLAAIKKWQQAHPERLRIYTRAYRARAGTRAFNLWVKYKLTLADYAALLELQKGVCAVCGRPEHVHRLGKLKPLQVDHCHRTGRIRGLLCQNCNTFMGHARDSKKTLRAALRYLELL